MMFKKSIFQFNAAKSRAVHINRDNGGWVQKGDEEINEEIEAISMNATLVDIPSKVKAVIRFGYDEGLKLRLGNQSFDDWIKQVFIHAQAHFRHPSLGTLVEFEVGFKQHLNATTPYR